MILKERDKMTDREAYEELCHAHAIILSNVERFNEAIGIAADALKEKIKKEGQE